jgi:dipeptidyl aminopeptidase/acylaminoacyl peptidase
MLKLCTFFIFICLGVHANAGNKYVGGKECQVFNRYQQYDIRVEWVGGCVDGFAEGSGVLKWFVGSSTIEQFEGEVKAGKMNGNGTITFMNGSKLTARFANNLVDGSVEFVYVNGDRYSGAWQFDHPEGQGRVEYKNGQIYQGFFSDPAATYRNDSPTLDKLILESALAPDGYEGGAISPDGKHVVMIEFNGTYHNLILVDTETLTSRAILKGHWAREGAWNVRKDPESIVWVTNDLIAVDYGLESETINLNGASVAEIGEAVYGKAEPKNANSTKLWVFTDRARKHLALVDAKTGKLNRIDLPIEGNPAHWTFDSNGELRAVTIANTWYTSDKALISNWYRPAGSEDWEMLAEFKIVDDLWFPVGVPDEPNKLNVMSRAGRDTWAVFSYDTKRRGFGELLAGHPTQDIVDVEGSNLSAFESVVTGGMKPETNWFDSSWNKAQVSVDAALPDRVNRLSGDPSNKILVYSYSDVDPGVWYLLDMKSMKMTEIVRRLPLVRSQLMRPMEILTYQARDGLSIPAYLTRPDKTAPAPLIVMVHGGPTSRDYWGWNQEVQMLAAHGYTVFQPQFRGSSGFGKTYESAGYGQWGLAMQDDITDGIKYLVTKGIADPKRICIYGGSYGGYAALWGMVKNPELYRCGVSFAGVSDIELMFHDGSDRTDDNYAMDLMKSKIGDAKKNRQKFDDVSPLKHADQIRGPILLMHGDHDQRVPIEHSEKMMKALDANHKTYVWVKFEDAGHGLSRIKDLNVFYEKMFTFLDANLQPDNRTTAVQGAISTETGH